MADFDPYLTWLDIPAAERPVKHHRLLSVSPGESNPTVIQAAADRVAALLGRYASGEHADVAHRLLAEVEQAKTSLLGGAGQGGAGELSANGETAIKPPPPVPGAANSGPAGGTTNSPAGGGEQQINAPLPPPGGGAAGARAAETQIPPPPVPGTASSGAPQASSDTGAAAGLPPPPGIPGAPSPPTPSGGAASISPAPHVPVAPQPGGIASPPGGPPIPAQGPPVPAPPPVNPPPATPPVTAVAQPLEPLQAAPPPDANAPTWPPSGRVGNAVTAATEKGKVTTLRTRKASTLRRKARRDSEVVAQSILFGVTAIIIGLIILLALVAFM